MSLFTDHSSCVTQADLSQKARHTPFARAAGVDYDPLTRHQQFLFVLLSLKLVLLLHCKPQVEELCLQDPFKST